MRRKRKAVFLLTIALGAAWLSGCSKTAVSEPAPSSQESEADAPRTIKIGFKQAGVPYDYVDEDGNITGCDVEVLRRVDELLPEYEFEFIPTDSPEAWTGTLNGKYQIAITNSFYTAERAEKYILPEQFLGVSVGGIIRRAEDADVTNFEEAVAKNLKMVPVMAGDGWQYVVEEFNRNHPDGQIDLELVESIDSQTMYEYIAEGRYDYVGIPLSTFDSLVTAEDGELHDQFYGKLIGTPFMAIKTYTLINKNETELAEKINDALKQLYEDGTMAALAEEFYGEDTYQYLDEE